MAQYITPAEEYIDLRRGIDHIGVGVCMVIHDNEGNILLMKRGQQARDERGSWDICGGAIEFGEDISSALKRELKEELSTSPHSIQFLGAYDAHRQHEGQPTHWIQLVHAVQIDPRTVHIGEPHKIDAIKWFTSKDLPKPLHTQFWKGYQLALDAGIVK